MYYTTVKTPVARQVVGWKTSLDSQRSWYWNPQGLSSSACHAF